MILVGGLRRVLLHKAVEVQADMLRNRGIRRAVRGWEGQVESEREGETEQREKMGKKWGVREGECVIGEIQICYTKFSSDPWPNKVSKLDPIVDAGHDVGFPHVNTVLFLSSTQTQTKLERHDEAPFRSR